MDKTVKLEWHKLSNTRTRCLRITQVRKKAPHTARKGGLLQAYSRHGPVGATSLHAILFFESSVQRSGLQGFTDKSSICLAIHPACSLQNHRPSSHNTPEIGLGSLAAP